MKSLSTMKRSKVAGLVVLIALPAFAFLIGCGIGATAPSTPETLQGVKLHGQMYGGQQPISGGHVYLYAAGTTGYGSAATSLLQSTTSAANNGTSNVTMDGSGNGYVTTGTNGSFTISGDYSCPSNAQVYLLALGGNPQISSGGANGNIALMAGLGSCSFLLANAGNTFITINEVTTVASVYALSQFMTSATNVGTSSPLGSLPGNAVGLTQAFKIVNNLVNVSVGSSPGSGQPLAGGGFAGLPTGMTVPSGIINTLADLLAYCVNSDPAVDNNCTTLFNDAPSRSGAIPTDTIQAILNIAQNPGANVTALWDLEQSTPPFVSDVSSEPNDWNLILQMANGGLNTPDNIAADGNGNIWTANNGASTVTEINPITGFVSGTTGYSGGGISLPYGIAIDSSNNAWVTSTGSNKGGFSKVSSGGTVSGPYIGGGLNAASVPRGIAVDSTGKIWLTVSTAGSGGTESLNEFNTSGVLLTGPIDVSGISSTSQPYGLAIDSGGFIWVANRGGGVARLTSSGAAVSGSPYTSGISGAFMAAFDSSGDAWIPNFTSSTAAELSSTGSAQTGSPFSGTSQINEATFVTIDGLNNVWVANFGSGCVTELSHAGTLLSGTCYGKNTLLTPHGFAIDASGDLWVGGGSGNVIFSLIGAAAPVVNPLVTATTNSQLGTRP